jgi:hypothetical protein
MWRWPAGTTGSRGGPSTCGGAAAAGGLEALRDRSKRPQSCPHETSTEIVGKNIYLWQNYHFGPTKIAMYLKRYHDVTISDSGVWRILKRARVTACARPAADRPAPHYQDRQAAPDHQPALGRVHRIPRNREPERDALTRM